MSGWTAAAVSWWCSGTLGQPWTWNAQPIVGVWVFVASLAGAYAWAVTRARPADVPPAPRRVRLRRALSFAAGLAVIWVSTDWPVGPLGAGYLASVAMARYLLLSLVATPLLILGVPPWLWRRLLASRESVRTVARTVTHPLVALIQFNVLMVVTHLPVVVDNVKVFQAGSFAMDMVWLASAWSMWWVAIGRIPEVPRLGDPLRMVYLFGQSVVPTVPASFLTFATYPFYRLYELSPRVVPWLDAGLDQQLAGLAMKIAGGLIIWSVIAGMFFKWAAREERAERGEAPAGDFDRELEYYGLRR